MDNPVVDFVSEIMVGGLIVAPVFALVGVVASIIWWKRHPNGCMYGLLGKKRRRPWWFY